MGFSGRYLDIVLRQGLEAWGFYLQIIRAHGDVLELACALPACLCRENCSGVGVGQG